MPLYDCKLLHPDTTMVWIGTLDAIEKLKPTDSPIRRIAPSSEGHTHDR